MEIKSNQRTYIRKCSLSMVQTEKLWHGFHSLTQHMKCHFVFLLEKIVCLQFSSVQFRSLKQGIHYVYRFQFSSV